MGFDDLSHMSLEDIFDDDVEVLLGKFFRNIRGVLVLPGALRHFNGWYEPAEVCLLLIARLCSRKI